MVWWNTVIERHWPCAFRATAVAVLLALLSASAVLSVDNLDDRFLADAQDLAFVTRTLEREREQAPPPIPVTGVTVPHHLLAADLIARGILAARGGQYERVLVISPDHFRALKTPFGITTEDLETVTGTLPADRQFAQAILDASSLFSNIGRAPREHGVHAVTPFVRSVFPHARVVAITTATSSTPANWRAAAELLGALIGRETLVVQSTDYSHFLSVDAAVLRDQETLAALASNDPEAVLALNQPNHMDSRASQFIQMSLQRNLYGASPVIVANRNAYEYSPGPGPTTSYVVTVFTPEPQQGGRLQYSDQTMLYFGGDTYVGRGFTQFAIQPGGMDGIVARIKDVTHDNPFVINLEGVVLEDQPAGANSAQHLMLSQLALPVLKKLGLAAANVANNHAYDFGEEGLAQMTRLLQANGIPVLRHGILADLGAVKVLPLTFKRGYFFDHPVIRELSQLKFICSLQSAAPLIVLVHWGADYTANPGTFEREVLDYLASCGVSAVIGSHSHLASPKIEVHSGGAMQSVFSTGNLIFDQTGSDVSGSLVEMRIFRQGTIALRLIPIPNFFAMISSHGRH